MNYHTLTVPEVLEKLSTESEKGLTEVEAKLRLQKFGPNRLQDATNKSVLKILFAQINNILTYILLVAVIFSALTDHKTDAIIVAMLILINIAIGFYNEYTAEKRVLSLKKLIQYRCTAIRDGEKVTLQTAELVPGDIVLLEDGQSVPADLRIIKANELTVIESSLTGESLPISKHEAPVQINAPLGDRINMMYMGTHITSGECKGVVVGTGNNTEIGKISTQLTAVKEEKSLFYKRTETLMRQMIVISIITALIAVVLISLRGESTDNILQFAFASLISGIPEGLPSVLTVLLSIAAVRMSKKKALLRNLPAIETLSTITTIITDKTGTLTQNVMNISEFMLSDGHVVSVSGEGWSNQGQLKVGDQPLNLKADSKYTLLFDFLSLMSQGSAVNKGSTYELTGYPTEIARAVLAQKAGFHQTEVTTKYEILDSKPYDQDSKYKVSLLKPKTGGKNLLVYLGGAEKVISLCKTNELCNKYQLDQANEGYRMQALAYRLTDATKIATEKTINPNVKKDSKKQLLELLAVFRISDPIRPNVHNAIELAHHAGIRVIMATGDHIATAFSIAKQAGIIPKTASSAEIGQYALSQTDIDLLTNEQLSNKLDSINVFARVTPSTKLKIAEILHAKGETIAMTGDGVNDAPVLKKADIGIAMGLVGTDVAKEASDLILLDDSFATIIDAIKEGRTVFRNIRQTSLYLITTNLAEDLMLILTLLLGYPLPLLPIQILWLNLVTDGLSDIALATEKSTNSILLEKPRNNKEGILVKKDFLFISVIAVVMTAITSILFIGYYGISLEKARTVAFAFMVFAQLFNVINMRSLVSPIRFLGFFSNKAINISLVISVLLFLAAIYVPSFRTNFDFVLLSFAELVLVFLAASSILIVGELYKMSQLFLQRRSQFGISHRMAEREG